MLSEGLGHSSGVKLSSIGGCESWVFTIEVAKEASEETFRKLFVFKFDKTTGIETQAHHEDGLVVSQAGRDATDKAKQQRAESVGFPSILTVERNNDNLFVRFWDQVVPSSPSDSTKGTKPIWRGPRQFLQESRGVTRSSARRHRFSYECSKFMPLDTKSTEAAKTATGATTILPFYLKGVTYQDALPEQNDVTGGN
eukprot:GHVT01102123.1.p1 GENE.GHVT01102123.1~~GHVT01102123.1.p1  ORF type:complete len:197 (+),score=23.83 GHVT01102123.1:440-1030(+)